MNYSEDHIALAAEYALGTLDADERALVETMMTVDHGFMDMVDAWAYKFAPLHEMVAEIEPPEHVWHNIKNAVSAVAGSVSDERQLIELPTDFEAETESYRKGERDIFTPIPDKNAYEMGAFKNTRGSTVHAFDPYGDAARPGDMRAKIAPASAEVSSDVVDLSARRKGGRAFGAVMTALAASLAGVIALQAYRPDLLPQPLRIKPEVQIVEAKAPPAKPVSAQMVALLQGDGGSPAFILTVDTATKNFTVRKIGASPESGKSYELWLVSDKLQKPRSLGLIGNSDFTIRPTLASYDADTINKATYAVTLEPEGGSQTGGPTGPVVYKGNLIESVPSGAGQIAPR